MHKVDDVIRMEDINLFNTGYLIHTHTFQRRVQLFVIIAHGLVRGFFLSTKKMSSLTRARLKNLPPNWSFATRADGVRQSLKTIDVHLQISTWLIEKWRV